MQYKIKIPNGLPAKKIVHLTCIIISQQAILGEVSTYLWLHARLNWFRIFLLSFPGRVEHCSTGCSLAAEDKFLARRGEETRRGDETYRLGFEG